MAKGRVYLSRFLNGYYFPLFTVSSPEKSPFFTW